MTLKKIADLLRQEADYLEEVAIDKDRSVPYRAFITGSRAYGKPKKHSDIDLVCLIGYDDLKLIHNLAEETEFVRHTPTVMEQAKYQAGPSSLADSISFA